MADSLSLIDRTKLNRATGKLVSRIDWDMRNTRDSEPITGRVAKSSLANSGITLAKISRAYRSRLSVQDIQGIQKRLVHIAGRFEATAFSQYFNNFRLIRGAHSPDKALANAIPDILGTQVIFEASSIPHTTIFHSILNVYLDRLNWVIQACSTSAKTASTAGGVEMPAYTVAAGINGLLPARASHDKDISGDQALEDRLAGFQAVGQTILESGLLTKPVPLAFLASAMRVSADKDELEPRIVGRALNSVAQTNVANLRPYEASWLVIDLWEAGRKEFQRFADRVDIEESFPVISLPPYVLAGHYLNLDELKPSGMVSLRLG